MLRVQFRDQAAVSRFCRAFKAHTGANMCYFRADDPTVLAAEIVAVPCFEHFNTLTASIEKGEGYMLDASKSTIGVKLGFVTNAELLDIFRMADSEEVVILADGSRQLIHH